MHLASVSKWEGDTSPSKRSRLDRCPAVGRSMSPRPWLVSRGVRPMSRPLTSENRAAKSVPPRMGLLLALGSKLPASAHACCECTAHLACPAVQRGR